jgi:hypothetical protein
VPRFGLTLVATIARQTRQDHLIRDQQLRDSP